MSELGDIAKLKVPELKAALKDRGLAVSGTKQVIREDANEAIAAFKRDPNNDVSCNIRRVASTCHVVRHV